MNKLMMLAAVGATAVMVGCQTDPMKYEQTVHDYKAYTVADEPANREGQWKIAVSSKLNEKHVKDIELWAKTSDAMRKEGNKLVPEMQRKVVKQIMEMKARTDSLNLAADKEKSAIVDNFSNLGWFQTVDRDNGIVIDESTISGNENAEEAVGADLVLVAENKVTYMDIAGNEVDDMDNVMSVCIETNFRLIDLASKQPIVSKTVKTLVSSADKKTDALIARATKSNAKKFARIVAARFLPAVKVIQTRGNGRFAQVAMGKNYTATPGARVNFLTYRKNGDKYVDNVFASGCVLEKYNQATQAWVDVDDFEAAAVLKGHSAKVSEEGIEGDDTELL